MTDDRTSPRRRAGSRRRPAPPPPFPITPVVLVGGVLAVVVLLFVLSGGDGDKSQAGANEAPPAKAVASGADAGAGTPRAGKTPTTPAPEIAADDLARADAHYDRAKELWTEAQLLRNKGESMEFGNTLRKSWAELEKLREAMAPYTEWFELANLDGWAMPSSYVTLQQRLNQWDPLRAKVQKLMPSAR